MTKTASFIELARDGRLRALGYLCNYREVLGRSTPRLSLDEARQRGLGSAEAKRGPLFGTPMPSEAEAAAPLNAIFRDRPIEAAMDEVPFVDSLAEEFDGAETGAPAARSRQSAHDRIRNRITTDMVSRVRSGAGSGRQAFVAGHAVTTH